MLINNIEIAELQNLEIKINYETTPYKIANAASNAKLVTGVNGTFSFTIAKTSSRFKPRLLASAKEGKLFVFDLYAEIEDISGTGLEGVFIKDCWVEGTFNLLNINAKTDFVMESFSGGFIVENATYEYSTQDGFDWSVNRETIDGYSDEGQRLIGVPLR